MWMKCADRWHSTTHWGSECLSDIFKFQRILFMVRIKGRWVKYRWVVRANSFRHDSNYSYSALAYEILWIILFSYAGSVNITSSLDRSCFCAGEDIAFRASITNNTRKNKGNVVAKLLQNVNYKGDWLHFSFHLFILKKLVARLDTPFGAYIFPIQFELFVITIGDWW